MKEMRISIFKRNENNLNNLASHPNIEENYYSHYSNFF